MMSESRATKIIKTIMAMQKGLCKSHISSTIYILLNLSALSRP